MVFNSYTFALFLPVVLGAYLLLRTRRRQNVLLVVASYVFYGAWDPRFLLLMWFTTVVDFFVGRWIGQTDDRARKRRILVLSLVANLGVLATFKYLNFFADSLATLLERIGFSADIPTLSLLLPIGISFYTFHGISYTVDVYRGDIEPIDDPITFAAFVAYFPQLVAGPIGRAQVQIPQFANERPRLTWEQARAGLALILIGFVRKVVIADAIAPSVNEALQDPSRTSSANLLAAVLGFSIQIYGDFAGYTDMARGVSKLFSIELLRNFDQPYLSRDIAAFWRRWHVSLSSWLRDYLYIPLGGNRGGRAQTYRNLMATMLLGGLWHGASWTFVAWGGLHGLYLVVHQMRFRSRGRAPTHSWAALPITFALVAFAWIFFRAPSFGDALAVITGIASLRPGAISWSLMILLVWAAVLSFGLDIAQRHYRRDEFLVEMRWPAAAVTVGALLLALVLFSGGSSAPFIYFQF